MKGQLITHGCWLGIAVAAYVLGARAVKDTGSEVKARETAKGGAFLSADGRTAQKWRTKDTSADASAGDVSEARPFTIGGGPLDDADIEDFAREALSDPNPVRRRLAFSKLLESLTPDNATTIRELLKQGRAGRDEWRDFHYAWGAIAGETAVQHGMDTRESDIAPSLTGWASASPDAAMAWFNALDADSEYRKGDFKSSLVGGLADHDLTIATDFVYDLAAGGDTSAADLLGHVASEYLRSQGPGASALWAERLPDGAMKGAAMDRVAHDYVATDPEAAAAWAERFADKDYAARVIEEVGDEWAERDPVAAVAWLDTLEEGKGKTDGMYSAFGEWARRDPFAASQHLTNMSASPERDAAVSGFVSRFAWEDPQAAIAWAATIVEDRVRERSLTRAAHAWFRRDADAALAWLPDSGLSPEAQKEVLSPRRDRRR